MKVEKITETEFRKMILTSSDRLNKNAEFINSLNVFPVPDGDTGTNMSLSFASGSKYVSESTSANVGDLAQALAKGLLWALAEIPALSCRRFSEDLLKAFQIKKN